MKYYYSTTGHDLVGPHTVSELQVLRGAGLLPLKTQICAEGQETWRPLTEFLQPTAPPPSVAAPRRKRRAVVAIATGAIALLFAAAVGFTLGEQRARASRTAIGAIFQSELTKFLEAGAQPKAFAAQNVPDPQKEEQLAGTRAAHELLRATWSARLPVASRAKFKHAQRAGKPTIPCLDLPD